ncbi:hypothetical protein CPC08DRAFT_715196, partial [Agrocybe pediades]
MIIRQILTLDPSRLDSVMQRIIDVSNMPYPRIIFPDIKLPPKPPLVTTASDSNTQPGKKVVKPPSNKFRLIYAVTYDGSDHRERFPEHTRGVLYYHKADPEVASSVRFRICEEPTLASFNAGHDLIEYEHELDSESSSRLPMSYRGPWNIPLHAIAGLRSYYAFRAALLQENLVDLALMEDLSRISLKKRLSRALYSYDQPFLVDLSKRQTSITLLARHCMHSLGSFDLFGELYPERKCAVGNYEGFALVRFVLSPLPQHAEDPSLLIQFVKFITPVRRVREKVMIKEPVLGGFLELYDRRKGTFAPFVFSLRDRAAGPKFIDAFGMPKAFQVEPSKEGD